jgi:hypothetical protein
VIDNERVHRMLVVAIVSVQQCCCHACHVQHNRAVCQQTLRNNSSSSRSSSKHEHAVLPTVQPPEHSLY